MLFGVSTPLVQQLGRKLGKFSTGGHCSAGAAAIGGLLPQPMGAELRVLRSNCRRLLAFVGLGAFLGPLA